jgi:ABC-type antimicrobial peptide transport system permease subunit
MWRTLLTTSLIGPVPLFFGRPIQTGDRDTAVISYGLWQRWFSDDREIVGKALVLDGQVYTITLLVRSSNPNVALIKSLNDALGALDRTAFIETRTMRSSLAFALLPSRAGAIITGSVGVLGVTLAAIGLYGVLLFAVTQRTKEIGLRIALGATGRQIIRMVLGESLLLCALGLALGLGVAIFAARPLSMFFVPGLNPGDPPSFIFVAGAMLGICLAATLPPVVRALRVDPMIALRHEN